MCFSKSTYTKLFIVIFLFLATVLPAFAAPQSTTGEDNDLIEVFARTMAKDHSPETQENGKPIRAQKRQESRRGNFKAGLFKAVHSVNGLIFISFLMIIFFFANLGLTGYTFAHSRTIAPFENTFKTITQTRCTLAFMTGLINLLLGFLLTVVLLKKAPLIGLLYGAWFVEKIVRAMPMTVSFIIHTDTEPTICEDYKSTFLNSLTFLSMCVIPLYGQYYFLKNVSLGIGAMLLSRLSPQTDAEDSLEEKTQQNEPENP